MRRATEVCCYSTVQYSSSAYIVNLFFIILLMEQTQHDTRHNVDNIIQYIAYKCTVYIGVTQDSQWVFILHLSLFCLLLTLQYNALLTMDHSTRCTVTHYIYIL
jgi:hypothetical protein